MKRLILLLVLLSLTGCAALRPLLVVTADRSSGHPGSEGMIVTFSLRGGNGRYLFDPGDGSTPIEVTGDTVRHTYSMVGHYRAVVSSGGASKSVGIDVLNSDPIVYGPFTVEPYDWMAKMVLDGRYLTHGCLNGAPVSATGARDPDGDEIVAYKWEISGPDGQGNIIAYSIFDSQGNDITGKKTDNAIVVCFLGWEKHFPPYPFVSPMCQTPAPPLPKPETLGTVTVTLRAYDRWGGVGEKIEEHALQSSACAH